jgi:hypothetical protein
VLFIVTDWHGLEQLLEVESTIWHVAPVALVEGQLHVHCAPRGTRPAFP